MTDNLKENNYVDLTQPSILNGLDYERDEEQKLKNFKSFNTYVNECINIIDDVDEKQKDETRDDSNFGVNIILTYDRLSIYSIIVI
ncbi:hypothetical protein C2G38_2074920 [Gigaspora rosea]|uniref:Uncharacterized protein n=1 Tax=Gigaspora rosea TaxID=44941 RepID=A0A397VLK3_9GLOM|nr:hypothetical protein C2G38_2074920 [Gigaspora rosea]